MVKGWFSSPRDWRRAGSCGRKKGRFVWPQAASGVVSLTPAMLSMLLEGIDWRMPAWTARPEVVG